MLTITTHRFLFFSRKETWFYDGTPVQEGSYQVYCYNDIPLTEPFDVYLQEETTRIDLKLSTEVLYRSMSKTFRYHIRKACKLGLHPHVLEKPSRSECEEFILAFNDFAKKKKIASANRKRIMALQAEGNIILSSLKHGSDTLISHAYLHDGKKIVLLHTFHHISNMGGHERGLANKYLHWLDMMRFREKGFSQYDLGGINFESVPGISSFKMSFGGKRDLVPNYIRIRPWLKPFFILYKSIR